MKDSGISLHTAENGHCFLTSEHKIQTSKKISFHKKLAGILGLSDHFLTRDTDDYISLTFHHYYEKNSTNVMNCKEFTSMSSFYHFPSECFPEPANVTFSISPWLFLYSNIVSPITMGHMSIPLLKIIPVTEENQRTSQMIEFDNVEYVSLAKETFQNISFELRDHQGTLVEIENGQSMITLSFKQN